MNSPAVDCDHRFRMKRVAQIMSDEHRKIDEIRVALCEALSDRSITRARGCLSSKPIRSDKLRFLLLATGNYAAFCQTYRW